MIFEIKDERALQEAVVRLCRFLSESDVPEERVFDSRLVVNELIGNIFRHSDGTARLHGEIRDGFVELIVFSSTPYSPPEKSRPAEVYAEHGRGLYLVDSVCAVRENTADGGIRVKIKIR